MASMGRKPKDAIAFARSHCTPPKGICQHPAQKKFLLLVYIDKLVFLEYNTINEQRRSWIGILYPCR